jgi:hypothetical protein
MAVLGRREVSQRCAKLGESSYENKALIQSAMKKAPMLFLLVLIGSLQAADEVEIKNGGFESGKQYWRGDGKVVNAAEGGKVCELKATERYVDAITQDIDIGKNERVLLTLRLRGVNYRGAGLRVAFQRRGGGSTFMTYEVPSDGSWKEIRWNFARNSQDTKFTLVLSSSVGAGVIQVDDVKLALDAASPNLPQ